MRSAHDIYVYVTHEMKRVPDFMYMTFMFT